MNSDKTFHQENDRRYKKLYENIELFRDLLTFTVKPPWLNQADLNAVELLKTESLAGSLAKRQSGLVWRLNTM